MVLVMFIRYNIVDKHRYNNKKTGIKRKHKIRYNWLQVRCLENMMDDINFHHS
jgi:hypothetical protein